MDENTAARGERDPSLQHQVIWCDLETGGLEPRHHQILEIALVETSGPALEVVDTFVRLVRPTTVGGIYTQVGEFAEAMHRKSRLLAEAEAGGSSQSVVGLDILQWLQDPERQYRRRGEPFVMGGSSVHFDMGFLREKLPAVAKLFSHRLLDVSALKLARNVQIGLPIDEGFARTSQGDTARHRALDDITKTIESVRALQVRRSDKDTDVAETQRQATRSS